MNKKNFIKCFVLVKIVFELEKSGSPRMFELLRAESDLSSFIFKFIRKKYNVLKKNFKIHIVFFKIHIYMPRYLFFPRCVSKHMKKPYAYK